MTVHRYRDRFDGERHTLEVPLPAWAWRLAVRAGARRDPLEISADQVRSNAGGPAVTFDYWAATEAPTT